MLRLYQAQFFYPFSMAQGVFKELPTKLEPQGEAPHFVIPAGVTEHDPATYAEYRYFHPHARDLLFNYGQSDKKKIPSLKVYEISPKNISGWTLRVGWIRNDQTVERTVHLDWVMAFLYDVDVGCLSFGVSWDRLLQDTKREALGDLSFEDVLDLNNLLRRTAPSFLDAKDIINYHGCPRKLFMT